ncbi:unnamed protein product [Brachionus calyciflorus]|uniref:DUF3668 domain-containing protein n=1 Tax=Brachionus calyciflorus TaxID=104777 RepID=A0A813QQ58_9BILA|nr:unnamed protein product [Brachionus calyciflorus]
MSKNIEKYLLVVSFLEGENFPNRSAKFIIEAKFDGEQLSTDPVDHNETIEINQELAWGLDKKSLQLHKLQRSCIKANCFSVTDTSKENIGYIVLDIRSAPEAHGKAKFFPLLQSKYSKLKPQIKVNIYIEEDPSNQDDKAQIEISEKKIDSRPTSSHSTRSQNDPEIKPLQISLNENEGYFNVGKPNHNAHTFVLTITVAFARNLVRLLTSSDQYSTSNFFFMYKFLENQVATKPFGDIISCQINGERSSIRLHSTIEYLKIFFKQLPNLEIFFCSQDRAIGKCYFNWKLILENWTGNSLNSENPIIIDELLKVEAIAPSRASPTPDMTMAPVIGLQIGLFKEQFNETVLSTNEHKTVSQIKTDEDGNNRKSPALSLKQSSQVIFQNDCNTITLDEKPKESVLSLKSGSVKQLTPNENYNYITEEMQLKAAYELQLWKETREKEFEQHLKKTEAKKFQALADAFKQRDIEREILIQKKLKEYNDLEQLLKNSLNEVEKREKQLALNETQISRIKSDLNREYENKLIELREASKRVQEKADHQVMLQKTKIESLEEEIDKLKKKVTEWERKYSDKEAEFSRYKEKENSRPEIRLQSEINVLNLEKIELDRKLDAMTKAKNVYKERWTQVLQEIALMKKREEANAKALLKKQQMELEHMKLKFLSAEENEKLKTDEQHLQSLKNEIEKLKLKNNEKTTLGSDYGSTSCLSNLENLDPNLQNHINRLMEEKETLLRTGVYSNTDAIIVELDKRIKESLNQARNNRIF